MNDEKKLGILLIAIGICIPLAALPFCSGYSKDSGVIDNLYRVGIELRKTTDGRVVSPPAGRIEKKTGFPDFSKLLPHRIPFRLFLVVAVILLYMGIVRIAAPSRQDDQQPSDRT